MPYGTIKIDTITFTDAGVDKSIAVSGLVQNPTFTGNVTVTGTISGATVRATTVSGVTVSGTTANFASGVYTTQISGAIVKVPAGTAGAPTVQVGTGASIAPGLYSPNADELGISTGGSFRLVVDSTGRVGIGTSSPEQQLTIVNNSTSVATGSTLSVVGGTSNIAGEGGSIAFSNFIKSGVTSAARIRSGLVNAITQETGYLVFETNGGAGLTERLRIDSSGRVGIGTSTPQQALSILGAVQKNISNINGEEAGFIGKYENQAGNTAGMYFNNLLGSNFSTWLSFKTTNASNNLLTAMTIDASQRVGIGTSTPAELLNVNGNIRLDTGELNTPKYLTFAANSTGAEYGGIKWYNLQWNSTVRASITSGSDVAVANGYLAFSTGISGLDATEKMRIDSSGRVGIGTTAPPNLLTVHDSGTAVADFVAGYIGSNSLGTGESRTWLTLQKGSVGGNYGGAIGGYLSQGVGGGLIFGTQNATATPVERMRIDHTGRLLVGSSSVRSLYNQTGVLQTEGTGYASSGINLILNNASTAGPLLMLGKSRGNANGSNTIVLNNDTLGEIYFCGADGSDLDTPGGSILCAVDGTPGANDMPGRLIFATTSDGASVPTERMRIESNGNIRLTSLATIYPETDNAVKSGGSGFRWSEVWAANGTIQTSDYRTKTGITDAALGSDFINLLRPVSYMWVEGGKRDTGERDKDGNYIYESVPGARTHWGFIAQEVKQAVDAAGVDFGGWVLTDKDDPDSQQALRYDQFIAPLTKALQETMAELEVLKAEVAALKAQ